MSYVEHNERLAHEFYTKHHIVGFYPAAHEQVPTAPLNKYSLFPFGYNPSIIRYNSRMLMAYRWHGNSDATTSLAIAELDKAFTAVTNVRLNAAGVPEDACVDDPRLFIYQNDLYCSFIISDWPRKNPPSSVVRYGKLTGTGIAESFQVKYGKNDGATIMEKNWIYFDHGGKLFCLYANYPKQTVLEVEADQVVNEYKSETPWWHWGRIRGGSAPLPYQDKLLRFFHARLDNEGPPANWRYYIGCCLMEPEPPFTIIKMSKTPIIRGSEKDLLTDMERSTCFHHKRNVVFPAGVVPIDDGFLVSIGVNDCQSLIAQLNEEHLHL